MLKTYGFGGVKLNSITIKQFLFYSIIALFIYNAYKYYTDCQSPACKSKSKRHCNNWTQQGAKYSRCVTCERNNFGGCVLNTSNSCVGDNCVVSA